MKSKLSSSLPLLGLIAIIAGCSKDTAATSVASQPETPLPAAAMPQDESNEPTPAERRLEWVKRPFNSSRTAALKASTAMAAPPSASATSQATANSQ
jgi:hypothetical protein